VRNLGLDDAGALRRQLVLLPDRLENPAVEGAFEYVGHEHYAYAPDIVDQGTETIDALAAGLLGGTAWYFWWD
jgi:hypothetical protein